MPRTMQHDAVRTSPDGWLGDGLAPACDGAGTPDESMARIAKVRRLAIGRCQARWGTISSNYQAPGPQAIGPPPGGVLEATLGATPEPSPRPSSGGGGQVQLVGSPLGHHGA